MSSALANLQRITIASDQIQANTLKLTPEQAHYLKRVLRLKAGDRFIANAPDHPWLAALTDTDSDRSSAQLLEALPPKPPLPVHIHLIAALPKTGFDEVVRQSTELGVGTLWPVLSDRTLLKPSPKKLQRWQRIAEEATEQCERAAVPVVQEPRKFAAAIAQVAASQRYICAARGEMQHLLVHLERNQNLIDSALPSPPAPLPNLGEGSRHNPNIPTSSNSPSPKLGGKGQGDGGQTISRSQSNPLSIAIAIGPEGGWTEHEIDQAIAQNYIPISLGPTILRAVTAPLAAIALILGHYSTNP